MTADAAAGVGYFFAAYFLYAVGDAAAKWLVASVPVWEVLFLRSWLGLAVLLALGTRRTWASLRRLPDHRSLLGMNLAAFGGWTSYYTAATSLPLPQLYMTYYLSPIVAALLAGPMLGERIPPVAWVAGALGFLGVIVTIDPLHAPAPMVGPALLGVASAACWALSSTLYRRSVHHCSSLDMVVFANVFIGVASAPAALGGWRSPSAADFGVLLLVTVSGLAAHFLYISALRRVPVAVAGPIGYFSLVWSVAIAYLVWGQLPHRGFFAGGALIVTGGAAVLLYQWRAHRKGSLSAGSAPRSPDTLPPPLPGRSPSDRGTTPATDRPSGRPG